MLAQLDTKTVYTFMDSVVTIEKYVNRAKELGYTHLGIMDKDNLYGAYSFIEECQKVGIVPIVACELEVELDGNQVCLQFLAQNTQGYRQLLKLSTRKMMGENSFAVLREHLEGVLVILPLKDGQEELDLGLDYVLGVYPDTPQKTFQRPILPLHRVRYFEEKEREVIQVLHSIRENTTLNQVRELPSNQALLSLHDFSDIFMERFPESLTYLERLIKDIHYDLDPTLKLPRFNRDKIAVEELRERAYGGLAEKGLTTTDYYQRLDRELEVIHQMGFDDYFLIVWDLLRFGRSQGYYMGMGRGSAVGSLVAYALDITGIDPVRYGLLFERFLNAERNSLPDIDIDIPDIYRPEFIRYVRERYGSLHTAQIVTFSTFGARQAIRDVFKRFGCKEYELGQLTKPISFKDSLKDVFDKSVSFRQLINSRADYQKAFLIAKAIEGQPRQSSIHAAGVVMSDGDLTDTIPLKKGEDMLITQYDAHAVEANGLLKMDFLGLRNLTLVQKMQEMVEKRYKKAIDIKSIDLEDRATLALFAKGQTKGIFQFEQAGAIHLLKRVAPSCFEEIVATTSLNRPGASDYADNFVKRKRGEEVVDLLDGSLEDILKSTYGIMLYQEQVMQIAQVYAGFSLGKADILRRAMSKKDMAEMAEMQSEFLEGSLAKGHDLQRAHQIFAMIAKFAGYGFNRSHAYAYSALAFQLAYFKVHFPDVFFDVMINYSSGDYITDAMQFGFKLGQASINTIPYHDKIQQKEIVLGLKQIKQLPRDLAYWIIDHRPFQGVEDFVLRLPEKWRKKEWLTPLVQLGLFDEFDKNRQKIVTNLDNLFVFVEAFGTFFAQESYSWTEAEDYSDSEKYELEQSIIGVGISPHPLVKISQISDKEFTALSDVVGQMKTRILVQIQHIHVIRTKKTGEQMAFVQVTDAKSKMDVTFFPDVYKIAGAFLKVGCICYITGRGQEREGQMQFVASSLEVVSDEKFWILVEDKRFDREIAKILEKYSGTIPVILHYQAENSTVQLHFHVEKSQELQEELKYFSMKTVFR